MRWKSCMDMLCRWALPLTETDIAKVLHDSDLRIPCAKTYFKLYSTIVNVIQFRVSNVLNR